MIYRGFDIENMEGVWRVRENGLILHTALSEDAAMTWVDAEKKQRRNG